MAKQAKPKFQFPEGVQAGISAHCMNCIFFKRPDKERINLALAGMTPGEVTEQNGKKFVTMGSCQKFHQAASFFHTCEHFQLNSPDPGNAED